MKSIGCEACIFLRAQAEMAKFIWHVAKSDQGAMGVLICAAGVAGFVGWQLVCGLVGAP